MSMAPEQESARRMHGNARFESYPYGDSTFVCGCGWKSPHMPTREDALAYGMEHFRTVGGFLFDQRERIVR